MRVRLKIVGAALLLASSTGLAAAQTVPPGLTVTHPSRAAASQNLSDLPPAGAAQAPQDVKIVPSPKALPPHGAGPGAANDGEGIIQRQQSPHRAVEPKTNFGGIGANGFIPPDPNIAVGKNDATGFGYIVQVVNSQIAVFDKTGKLLKGPVSLSSLWNTLGGDCAANNAGDPVVQYDAVADRWLVSQLGSTSGPNFSECIAVSQSNDPRGAYTLYSYPFGNNLNDYPKFGVWPTATNSAYFASYNLYANGQSFVGASLCAYDRQAMIAGDGSAVQICTTIANDGGFLPADLDGATPPADGTAGYFLNFETLSTLRLYQLAPDFTTKTATLSSPMDIAVASFSEACGGATCIAQPNSQKLDSLGDRLMYRLAYRVFSGDHAAMVVNHSVTAGSSVGVRWYELRQPAAGGAFSLYQQGTFAPSDGAYRWMGSAAMDGAGNIAVGYSKSSSSLYPSIAFTSRTPGMTAGTMGTETILQAGNGAQTTYSRWGDYTSLRIDPSDDAMFWYTNEYYANNSRFFNYVWSTAIGSFTVAAGGGGTPPDFSLSTSPTSLTLTRGGSSAATTVTATALNGSSSVSLSVTGLPRATSASFNPNPVTATGASTLTIQANRNAPKGTFGATISGSNGSATHAIPLMVTIQ
jgi:hypothetical protein